MPIKHNSRPWYCTADSSPQKWESQNLSGQRGKQTTLCVTIRSVWKCIVSVSGLQYQYHIALWGHLRNTFICYNRWCPFFILCRKKRTVTVTGLTCHSSSSQVLLFCSFYSNILLLSLFLYLSIMNFSFGEKNELT